MAIRRLVLDIETSPNDGTFWRAGFKLNIPHENIRRERAIICIAWKWEGVKGVHALSWDKGCDKEMVAKFIPILDSADEVVTHNGDRFDLSWLRTRAIFHDIPMSPYIVSQDTLKVAKRYFYFNSNRLAYIAKFLGVGGKISTTYDLWQDIMYENDETAMKLMVKYCKHDVKITEEVWKKLKPYIPAKSHTSGDVRMCPECGGSTHINKTRLTAAGYGRLGLQCNDCGRYSTVAASRI